MKRSTSALVRFMATEDELVAKSAAVRGDIDEATLAIGSTVSTFTITTTTTTTTTPTDFFNIRA